MQCAPAASRQPILLEFLDGSNLFVIPLDSRRQWYRYHHLFADLLRERLETSPTEVGQLHRRATRWYASNDFIPQAVEHALSAADYDQAITLILGSVVDMFISNRLSTLLRWWQAIPHEITVQYPNLGMAAAWAWLATGHFGESERSLLTVEQALGSTTDLLWSDMDTLEPGLRNGLIEVATIRVSHQMASQTDVAEVLQICHRILPFLTAQEQLHLFNPPIALRPVVLFNMGIAFQTFSRFAEALEAFTEASELAQQQSNGHLVAPALAHLAETEIILGRLVQATATCHRGIALLANLTGATSPLTGLLHVQLGSLHYEWNDLDTAIYHLQAGIAVALPWRNQETLLPAYLGLARSYRALGNEKEALAAQEAFDELIANETDPVISPLKAGHVWLLAQQGDLEPARRWAQNRAPDLDQTGSPEAEAIILAKIKLLLGDNLEETSQMLSALLASAVSGGRWGRVVKLLVLQAEAFVAQGQWQAALASLSRALKMAEAQAYVRTFVDPGQSIAQLIPEAARIAAVPVYGRKLSTAFLTGEKETAAASRLEPSPGSPHAGSPSLLEPLSARELEVLQFIASGLTNKEIAARLHLSPGTVKVHAHNIYGKLNANGRTQAIATARSLNILH